MEKKRWAVLLLGVNTLIHRVGALLVVSIWVVLATSTPAMAAKAVCGNNMCEPGENANKCPGDCNGDDDGDTTASKKSIALIMTFDAFGINILSDDIGPYVDREDGARVSAAEHTQPNGAAGIHLGMSRKNGRGRQLLLDITCEGMDVDLNPEVDGPLDIDNCDQLPAGFDGEFSGFFPDCEVGNNFCDFGAAVRPYK